MPEPRYQRLVSSVAILEQAREVAGAIGDARSVSFAWGYLGRIYEEERRYAEALELTGKALFAAQQADAPDALFRWQWQVGRIHQVNLSTDEAIEAYRSATATLKRLRAGSSSVFVRGSAGFKSSVEPVYFGLVDLLLQRVGFTEDPAQRQAYLREARDRIEELKTVELQEYFEDECLTPQRTTAPDSIPGTVVVYPIILADRTELIVSFSNGLRSLTVSIDRKRITAEVGELRRLLEKRTTREYLPHAQTLYDWLVRPVEAVIGEEHVDALVFVPDGVLRTIPMAALHDRQSQKFLIEKFPVAITRGLTLTDPRRIDRTKVNLLMGGLTQAVQGYPALVNVPSELEAIRNLFGGRKLVDEDFVEASIERELDTQQFSIVHIASHGEFAADQSQSFLLTYDGRLTMDRLGELVRVSQFHDEPLELLTLSACQTAAGDERAALGLAGVAVRSGARSALATLWPVNDQAAAVLVSEFYAGLAEPKNSRAQAVRRAQLKLLHSRAYRHPGYWSPFLLISSWL
jgi:CHAT domain-containing protein